jgi:hypothetical protein
MFAEVGRRKLPSRSAKAGLSFAGDDAGGLDEPAITALLAQPSPEVAAGRTQRRRPASVDGDGGGGGDSDSVTTQPRQDVALHAPVTARGRRASSSADTLATHADSPRRRSTPSPADTEPADEAAQPDSTPVVGTKRRRPGGAAGAQASGDAESEGDGSFAIADDTSVALLWSPWELEEPLPLAQRREKRQVPTRQAARHTAAYHAFSPTTEALVDKAKRASMRMSRGGEDGEAGAGQERGGGAAPPKPRRKPLRTRAHSDGRPSRTPAAAADMAPALPSDGVTPPPPGKRRRKAHTVGDFTSAIAAEEPAALPPNGADLADGAVAASSHGPPAGPLAVQHAATLRFLHQLQTHLAAASSRFTHLPAVALPSAPQGAWAAPPTADEERADGASHTGGGCAGVHSGEHAVPAAAAWLPAVTARWPGADRAAVLRDMAAVLRTPAAASPAWIVAGAPGSGSSAAVRDALLQSGAVVADVWSVDATADAEPLLDDLLAVVANDTMQWLLDAAGVEDVDDALAVAAALRGYLSCRCPDLAARVQYLLSVVRCGTRERTQQAVVDGLLAWSSAAYEPAQWGEFAWARREEVLRRAGSPPPVRRESQLAQELAPLCFLPVCGIRHAAAAVTAHHARQSAPSAESPAYAPSTVTTDMRSVRTQRQAALAAADPRGTRESLPVIHLDTISTAHPLPLPSPHIRGSVRAGGAGRRPPRPR